MEADDAMVEVARKTSFEYAKVEALVVVGGSSYDC